VRRECRGNSQNLLLNRHSGCKDTEIEDGNTTDVCEVLSRLGTGRNDHIQKTKSRGNSYIFSVTFPRTFDPLNPAEPRNYEST
jgi:hypothetical protein